MKRFWRKWASKAVMGVLGLWALDARPANAQMNTYADVPFNQGSLFYRPSGARPPATTSVPSTTAAPATRYAPQRGVTYYYPTTGTYYYPQYQYRQRRGLFGRLR
ncbi:MAG: hypothetical protein P4L84_35960 [Isosphaeraceae bacterium]|nr:hypothetical protein [Isosphaeraceae bacterium]